MTGTVRAPELDSNLGWLNTDRALRFGGELRGRVVVLDFWTYCCMNCMHILPDLAWLEEKYADLPVAFIGVHSAKFTNEASRETIRAAVHRYEIKHPVIIDDQMKIWRSYAVRSWPTLVVVGANGYVVASVAGEGSRDVIDAAIDESLALGRAAGGLADGPLTLRREAGVRAASGLKFPGKVHFDPDSGWLFVADSNHNRIVIAKAPDAAGNAQVVKVVGSGAIGVDDGPAETASFNHPQGLVTGQGNLYVADTENHMIRAIDLATFEVSTLVGTGEMSNDRAGGGMGTGQGLNSPWGLTIEGATLYVAMAGTHQLWRIDLPVGFARAFAGNGRENIVDGPTETSAWAQPSGICRLGGNLYVADSEVSAVRGVDMAAEKVFTVIGEGLFSFGDVDGTHPKAKLQHPLGIAAWGSSLLVADTYNHKIKLVDPGARSVRTLYGTGEIGASAADGGVQFFEPGGLAVGVDTLYVADTNNHRVVRVDLKTNVWHEVAFDGLTAPGATDVRPGDVIDVETIHVAAGRDIELQLDIELPEVAHLNPEAPWSVRVTAGGATMVQRTGKAETQPLSVTIAADVVAVGGTWRVEAAFACCTEGDRGLCIPVQLAWHVPIAAGGDAATVRLVGKVAIATILAK